MRVKPAPDIKVRDPDLHGFLPDSGRVVPESGYWRRRLRDGDVIAVQEATPPRRTGAPRERRKKADTAQDVPAKAAKKAAQKVAKKAAQKAAGPARSNAPRRAPEDAPRGAPGHAPKKPRHDPAQGADEPADVPADPPADPA
jgi:hypothetical protein